MGQLSALLLQAGSGSLSRLPLHRNKGLEIVFLERGTLQWEVEGRIETIRAGSIFYTLPWERHGSIHEYEPGHRWHFLVFSGTSGPKARDFHLPPQHLFSSSDSRRVRDSLMAVKRRCWPGNEKLAFLIPQLVRMAKATEPLSDSIRNSLGTLILAELSEIISNNGSDHPKREPRTARVTKWLAHLEANCTEHWTLTSMAAACGIKRTYFNRLVQEITGDSPLACLRRFRIERARKCLRQSSLSITEIALACGFESSQHFARIFKQFTGTTAGGYRLDHQSLSKNRK